VRYNPFAKAPRDIQPGDIVVLKDVREGWYVEYKRVVPSAASIAKSVSAFANHYGGWCFYGIEEKGGGDTTAGVFAGVADADLEQALSRIRDAVATNLSPAPHFDVLVLPGPVTEIALAAGHSVIAVVVPLGGNPPYVHRDGRIYRRVADRSDPAHEADRAVLDLLWERGRLRAEALTRLLERSEAEENTAVVRIVVGSDLLGDREQFAALSFDEFTAVIHDQRNGQAVSLGFDNVFCSADGYVARGVGTNNVLGPTLTWEFSLDGHSTVSWPIGNVLPAAHSEYHHYDRFLKACSQRGLTGEGAIVDVGVMLPLLMAVVSTHRRLAKAANLLGPFSAKVHLHNVRRRVPFVDAPAYVEFVEKFGPPVIQSESTFAPPGTSPSSLILLQEHEVDPAAQMGEFLRDLKECLPIFSEMVEAFGIPAGILLSQPKEFYLATDRARRVAATAPGRA
jgi:hypothetical protein